MGYRWIDMENYPRIQHFAYFRGLAYPYVGLTAEVDITLLMQRMERERIPFFLTVCYCAARAANAVPQLRQRIRGDKIIEFDRCMTSHTVALEDGTYCYCTLDSGMAFGDFLSYAARVQERASTARSLGESEEDAEACFFVSTLPWLTYTALVQPVPQPADSNPRITWGRYFTREQRTLLPVSLLCHHALVDGIHIAAFYRELDKQIRMVADNGKDGKQYGYDAERNAQNSN